MKKKWISIILLVCFMIGLTACSAFDNGKRLAFGTDKSKLYETMEQADRLASQYYYDEAIALLNGSIYHESDEYAAKIAQYEAGKSKLVEYHGPIYHVFFHSLIVYPELAFDGDIRSEGYNMWMTTVSEFKAMLPQLMERGFILYPLNEIKKDQKVILPEGKKPLIISIDDVNYYEYMKRDGFAEKLVFNEAGDVVCQVTTPQGETVFTYDGDVMPILDQFVKENPSFSFHGAKGVIAVTGYEGALGYRITDLEGAELEEARKTVSELATAMRNNGWLFANHSYTHNEYFKSGKVELSVLQKDTKRWKETIGEHVGNPDIYISPFGYHLDPDDPRLQYLQSEGYTTFCPVGMHTKLIYGDDIVIQERFNLDRYNMRTKKDYINKTFFDVDSVYYSG